MLSLAAAWAIELRTEPWIVEVVEPDIQTSGDVGQAAYPARLARRLAADSGHPVQFEVLHGHDVHDEIAENDEQLKMYVALLEAEFDRRAEAQIPSADDLGSAFEEFLRDQPDS